MPTPSPRAPLAALVALAAAPAVRAQFSAAHVIEDAGPQVASVHAADLDGDGDRDVLVCRDAAPTLAWHENLGAGAFGPAQGLPAMPFESLRALTIDLEGDGDLDVLAISDYYTPQGGTDVVLERFLNLGGGVFGSGIPLAGGSSFPVQDVSLGDLEGDGDLDVLYLLWPARAGALLLEGGAITGSQVLTDQLSGARAARLADLDGDGDADLLAAEVSLGRVVWLENPGAGAFGPLRVLDGQAPGALSVGAADLDGDGDLDPFSAHASGSDREVRWYRNLGGGAFGPPVVVTAEGAPAAVSAADLDGDGDRDLLVQEALGAAWYANDGRGGFGPRQEITAATIAGDAAAADLDGDGAPDVVVGARASATPRLAWHANRVVGPLGRSYCGPAVPNSTGGSGEVAASGSYFAGANDVLLVAQGLPPDQAGLFAASRTVGLVPSFGGGAGTLCLGGAIHRLLPAQGSGPAGSFALPVDLAALPVLPGESWSFQAWHRDLGGTSNLTDAVRVTFAP